MSQQSEVRRKLEEIRQTCYCIECIEERGRNPKRDIDFIDQQLRELEGLARKFLTDYAKDDFHDSFAALWRKLDELGAKGEGE